MSTFPWDSAYILTKLKEYINRPTAADAIGDPAWYLRLTDAQMQIVTDIAAIYPDCLYPTVAYGSIPTMTTTDNKNFTFGLDVNGAQLAPIGNVGIYRSLNDIPTNPLVPWSDYIPLGGTTIQAPNNQTLPSVLYWRGIAPPGEISATLQPILFPEGMRELIAMRAAITFLMPLRPDIAALWSSQYGYPLANNPGRFAFWMEVLRNQYTSGGALGSYTGLQIALSGSYNLTGYGT